MLKITSAAAILLAATCCSVSFASQVCYENGIGCFSDDAPWDNMPLPSDPAGKDPVYMLFRKDQEMQVIQSPDELNLEQLIVITHGFAGNWNNTEWWASKIERNVHIIHPETDVLFVEWAQLAELGKGLNLYHQPASNVRLISQMIALWLKSSPKFDSKKVHCIGFSLGAHVCGLTAKRLGTPWGRLSAIDPAGPAFIKDDPVARVHKSDGLIVDVLHSSWLSLRQPIGHKDFYVNNAKVQPGCFAKRKRRDAVPLEIALANQALRSQLPSTYGLIDTIESVFGCSHYRAVALYAETILPVKNCSFRFCRCQSQAHFDKGYCRTCKDSDSQLLGYRSIESDNSGTFYGATTDKEPFCLQ